MASVIGTENSLSDRTIGQALALSQLAGIAGTSVPALAGGRLPPFTAIGIGILICALPCIVLLAEISDLSFWISACLLQFGWNNFIRNSTTLLKSQFVEARSLDARE